MYAGQENRHLYKSDEEYEPRERIEKQPRRFLKRNLKKRRILVQSYESAANEGPQLDLLDFIFFVTSRNIPVLMKAEFKPHDRWGLLGEGASYLAYKVRDIDSPDGVGRFWAPGEDIVLKRTYATSSIHTTSKHTQSRFLPVMSELAILWNKSIMEHYNIVKCLGVTWDIEQDTELSIWPVLILEYCECGSLAGYVKNLSFEEGFQICVSLADALLCLHSCGVAHCDIKPKNVLLFVEYCEDGSVVLSAKLSDFGCAVLEVTERTDLPNGIAKTRPWNAPESGGHLKGFDVFKTDIFSFGMIFWWIILGDDPVFDVNSVSALEKLEENKKAGKILELALVTVDKRYSGTQAMVLGNLLKLTVAMDPKSRATSFETVLQLLTGEQTIVSRCQL